MSIFISAEKLSETDPEINRKVIQSAINDSDDGHVIIASGRWPLKPTVKGAPLQNGLHWPNLFHALEVRSDSVIRGEERTVLVLDSGIPPRSTAYTMFRVKEGSNTVAFMDLHLSGGLTNQGVEADHHGVSSGFAIGLLFSNVVFYGFRGKGAFLGGHPEKKDKRILSVDFKDCIATMCFGQFFTAVGVDELTVHNCRAFENGNYASGGGAEAIILSSTTNVTIEKLSVDRWGSAISVTSSPGTKNVSITSCTFNDQNVSTTSKNMMGSLKIKDCTWDYSESSRQRNINTGFASSQMIFVDNRIIGGGGIFYLSFSGNGLISNSIFDLSLAGKSSIFLGQKSEDDGLLFMNSFVLGGLSVRDGCRAISNVSITGNFGAIGCRRKRISSTYIKTTKDIVFEGCLDMIVEGLVVEYQGNERVLSIKGCDNFHMMDSYLKMISENTLIARADNSNNTRILGGRLECNEGLPTTFGKISLEGVEIAISK